MFHFLTYQNSTKRYKVLPIVLLIHTDCYILTITDYGKGVKFLGYGKLYTFYCADEIFIEKVRYKMSLPVLPHRHRLLQEKRASAVRGSLPI